MTEAVKKTITAADLALHNKQDDLWLAIGGKVYDLTKWATHHPGGEHLLHSTAGQDVTSLFRSHHTDHGSGGRAFKMLANLPHIANIEQPAKSKLAADFENLQEEIDRDGLYNTSVLFYLNYFCWSLFLLGISIFLVLRATDASSTWLAAFAFGAFLQQTAFLGHDTAHNGITHIRFWDMVIGVIVGPLSTGISTAWWKRNHNTHHVVTNSITHDPDIQHMPVLAITDEFWKRHGGTFSFYYKVFFRFDSLAKVLLSYQHWLFYPIMGLARWNLYVQGWLLLLNFNVKVEWRLVEMVALMAYYAWLSLLVSFIPTAGLRTLFLFGSHFIAGSLHVQIVLSHFAMPTFSGPVYPEGEMGEVFLRQQLATSMDVESCWWNDWFYGGLQWQAAHHLFPRLPRHSLRRAREKVQELCREHGLEYKSVGWWEGNAMVIRTLYHTAMRARESKPMSLRDSEIWKALNAEG